MSKQLFEQIESVVPTLDGWCDVAKAHALAAMVLTLRPDVSLEIGVFGGRSFLPLAMAHREIGRGVAIGIDPWDNAAASEGYEDVDKDFWSTTDLSGVFQRFNKRASELGVQHCIKIVRQRSDAVEPPTSIGILHVDGQHTDQAVKDCQRFAQRVSPGGLIILDYLQWRGGGVLRARAFLQSNGFKELYPLGTGAVFQKMA